MANSFYDWELNFHKKKTELPSKEIKEPSVNMLNSLGIEEAKFKKFLDDWKKRNFT